MASAAPPSSSFRAFRAAHAKVLAKIGDLHRKDAEARIARALQRATGSRKEGRVVRPSTAALTAAPIHLTGACRCCETRPSRACACKSKCLASISHDVRKTQCEVQRQGDRVVRDVDLLRGQLLARLASIETSLEALAGTPITLQQVLAAPGGTFVISAPGHYSLAENIVVGGVAGQGPVFEIVASNVVLDLGAFVLEQEGATIVTGRTAIVVNAGASNVTVQNGTIRGFAGAFDLLPGSDLVVLQRLRMLDIAADATFLENPTTTTCIVAVSMSNLIVRQTVFDHVRGDCIFLSSVDGFLLEDSLFTRIFGGNLDHSTAIGVEVFDAGTTASRNFTIRRVVAEQFTAATPPASSNPAFLAFFDIYGSSTAPAENFLFEDLLMQQFTGSEGSFTSVLGIYFEPVPTTARNLVFRRVVAQDISATSSVAGPDQILEAFGIWVIPGVQTVVEDCVFQNIRYQGVPNPSPSAFAGAFGLLITGSGARVRGCSAMQGDTTQFGPNPDVFAVGFLFYDEGYEGSLPVTGLLCENNYCSGYVSGNPAESESGVGFGMVNVIDSVIRGNVATQNSYAGIYVFDALIGTLPLSSNNLYESNTAVGNSLYGFLDTTASSNNAYIDNFARSNPGGNYVGPERYGAAIVTWAIPAPAPTAGVTKLSNLSVTP